ncbi:N-acetylmuramoyl-L-alanine amidase family protein [Thermoanaerobacterium sp. DL9XJH110]|uniref:N-acetylmuramoyl-L-alanine amidase family protein n=1 Tax=Thermoanaerobacterium sp. DL9XJH110 TaxID=3386643 RepID=UPI003BB81629
MNAYERRGMWKKPPVILILCGMMILIFVCRFLVFGRAVNVFRMMAPLTGRVIVIDPGHGGIDGGTYDDDGTLEKDINLQISLKLKRLCEKNGANVIMTRTSDTALDHLNSKSEYRHKRDLIARADIINKARPDVFLSIHVNAEKSSSKTRGPMVLYFRGSEESRRLASLLQKRLEEAYTSSGEKIRSRLPLPNSSLFLLINTNAPGVILELGFITNPGDKALLTSQDFQHKLCASIFEGLKDYF